MRWPWHRRPRPDLDAITEDADRRLAAARRASAGGVRAEAAAQQKAVSDHLARQNKIAKLVQDGFR